MPERPHHIVREIEDMGVASWCPPGRHGHPTQVWLHFSLKGMEGDFVLRLKSRDAVDRLIHALTVHRDDVFPAGT